LFQLQEIDDVISVAQNHGYMHVLRLGSKSVNYANRIIMQEPKADGNYQLMKNISLSSMSDGDDIEELLRLRKLSVFDAKFNYGSYEHLEQQRRKPSVDYR